jgi:V8-like Glu-specific endopeptidase
MARVRDADRFPYSCVGLLVLEFGADAVGVGTGALIDESDVLTCGHNLYNGKAKAYATKAFYHPHYNSEVVPNGGIKVGTGFIPEQYVKAPAFQGWDIGIYRLADRVYRQQYLQPKPTEEHEAQPPNPLRIAGYPTNHQYEMWEDEQPWHGLSVEHNVLIYSHETEAGSSGSPIHDANLIYAVHGGLIGDKEDKRGCLITIATARFIGKALRYGQSDHFITGIGL